MTQQHDDERGPAPAEPERILLVSSRGTWTVDPALWEDPHIKLIFEEYTRKRGDDWEPIRLLSEADAARRVGLKPSTIASNREFYGLPRGDVAIGTDDEAEEGYFPQTVDEWWRPRVALPDPPEQKRGMRGAKFGEDGERIWEAEGAADKGAMIVSAKGTLTPGGTQLCGTPTTIGGLVKLAAWRWKPARGAKKSEKQIWLTPGALRYWGLHKAGGFDELVARVVAELAKGTDQHEGWELVKTLRPWWLKFKTPDDVVLLALPVGKRVRNNDGTWKKVDLGPYGELEGVGQLPDDEERGGEAATAQTLGERVAWLARFTGELPDVGFITAGARVFDAKRKGHHTSVRKDITPAPLPPVLVGLKVIEPVMGWRDPSHKKKDPDTQLVEVDQRSAYLVAAGAVSLGYGGPLKEHLPDEAQEIVRAVGQKRKEKDAKGRAVKAPLPFGAWHITVPPAKELGLNLHLPFQHKNMQWAEPATFWATSQTLEHLAEPIDEGGAGIDLEHLVADHAFTQPEQAQLLRPWKDLFLEALRERERERPGDFEAYRHFLKQMYVSFLGRLDSDKWPHDLRYLHQPLWYDAVRANCTRRANRYAARIFAEHGWTPEQAATDAFLYRLPKDTDPALLQGRTGNLGEYRIKSIRPGDEQEAA